jgi:hypothetical protein
VFDCRYCRASIEMANTTLWVCVRFIAMSSASCIRFTGFCCSSYLPVSVFCKYFASLSQVFRKSAVPAPQCWFSTQTQANVIHCSIFAYLYIEIPFPCNRTGTSTHLDHPFYTSTHLDHPYHNTSIIHTIRPFILPSARLTDQSRRPSPTRLHVLFIHMHTMFPP